MQKVILEGCNGEWAQECYLPVLAGEAAKGNIELWAVDKQDKIKLGCPKAKEVEEVRKDWQVAQSRNRAHYLNKDKNKRAYRELSNASYVFVVTPDRFHSEIAKSWLDKLAPEGKIFIEKPLDTCVEAALSLKEEIEGKGKKEAVFAFDHYLARAYPFLEDSTRYFREIGKVEKIEFHILEASQIFPQREQALDKGMIFDLFCHVLALVCAVVKQNSSDSETKFQEVKLEKVKAARYCRCPISGETFALIELTANGDIEVVSAVGKCVGTSDEKFMKICGSEGQIKLDFSKKKDRFSIFDSQGKMKEHCERESRHVESFLEELLPRKKQPLSAPGVLSLDEALDILTILDRAKRQIGDKMPEYQCKDSIDKILERF